VRLLLDMHTLVWSVLKVSRLSSAAADAIADTANEVLVSVALAWEISTKVGKGKWPEANDLLIDFKAEPDLADFGLLAISIDHVRRAGLIVAQHGDPFDRLLAAQAQHEGLTVVTERRKNCGARCAMCVVRLVSYASGRSWL
jgi:PIN domain nuclease of toxin-antitoxin system